MRESEIQRAILDWLKARGVLRWRQHMDGVRTASGARAKNPMKGFPDVCGVLPGGTGRMFTIEVKTAKGRFDEEQERWHELLTAKGVLCIRARSLEDVVETFDAYERFGA